MAPRTRVLRHESELGAWTLVRRQPDARLRGYVAEYEGYVERSAASQVLRQQVPTTQLPLIINFGSHWAASEEPHGPHELHQGEAACVGRTAGRLGWHGGHGFGREYRGGACHFGLAGDAAPAQRELMH